MRRYITSARGHELSGRVRAHDYNIIMAGLNAHGLFSAFHFSKLLRLRFLTQYILLTYFQISNTLTTFNIQIESELFFVNKIYYYYLFMYLFHLFIYLL